MRWMMLSRRHQFKAYPNMYGISTEKGLLSRNPLLPRRSQFVEIVEAPVRYLELAAAQLRVARDAAAIEPQLINCDGRHWC